MSHDNITIGKFILDNLTTGMYNDPFCIYREYIQNAADAIDRDAYSEKKNAHKDYEIRIKLDPDPMFRLITIEDDGCGVPVASAEKTLLSLGDSTKTSDRERGFRGIGRLGGIAYCDTLIFTTKAKGETEETHVEWNCREFQKLLNRHNDDSRHLEAKDLIAHCVTVKFQKSPRGIRESFFRVEMTGVKEKLLDKPKVRSYIEEVAPLPFDIPQFHFGKQLDEWLRKEIHDYNTYRIFLNDSLLTKKYRKTLPIHGNKSDELVDCEKFDIQDRQDKVIARGWLGVRRDNIGAVLDSSGFNSLRVRAGNILIGGESFLDPRFATTGSTSNTRFNGNLVGEIHVATRDLVPNGRRDDFQDSEMKTDFLCGVDKFVIPLIKKIRDDSSRKNSVKPIDVAKQTIIGVNKQLENGFVGDAEKKEAMATLRTADQKLTEIQKKRNVPDAVKDKAEAVSENVKSLITEVKETDPSIDGALKGTTFSKNEKELIRMVLEAMYELYEKSNGRDDLKIVLFKS